MIHNTREDKGGRKGGKNSHVRNEKGKDQSVRFERSEESHQGGGNRDKGNGVDIIDGSSGLMLVLQLASRGRVSESDAISPEGARA